MRTRSFALCCLPALLLMSGCGESPELRRAEAVLDSVARTYGTCLLATAGGGSADALSSYAFVPATVHHPRSFIVTCVSGASGSDVLTLYVPGVGQAVLPDTGRYTVVDPNDHPQVRSGERIAWGDLRRDAGGELVYRALGGEVVIERTDSGVVAGAFNLALGLESGPERTGLPMLDAVGGAFAARAVPGAAH